MALFCKVPSYKVLSHKVLSYKALNYKLLTPCLALSLCFSSMAQAQQNKSSVKVIDPDKKVTKANAAALDTEHFEVGFYTGLLSVEDFNTNPVFGASLRYYINEKIVIEGNVGTSETERANTEGNQDFNPDRDFSYIGVAAGYQILKGRSFLGKKRKFNTGLYTLAGIEQVDFADDSNTGIVLSISYKTIITDWLAINLDLKNHIVQRDFLGDDKTTQNSEFAIGINTFF